MSAKKTTSTKSPGKTEARPRTAKVTIKDIANACGMSVSAVSLALAGKADRVGLSSASCEKIEETAEKLGYRPNAYRMALKSSLTNCVSLLLSEDAAKSFIPKGLIFGIEEELIRHNMHLAVSTIPDSEPAAPLPKFLREWMTDGFLINYTHAFPETFEDVIERHRIPCIWINSIHKKDCIHPDDREAMSRLVKEFISRGHRRILYMNLPMSLHYSFPARREGYLDAMEEAGLQSNILVFDRRNSIASAMEILADDKRPTAVIGYGPGLVSPFLVAAARLGLWVPRDLSLATVADWHPDQCGMRITYMRTNARELGVKAVDMLLRKLKDPDLRLEPVKMPCTFDPGDTLADAL